MVDLPDGKCEKLLSQIACVLVIWNCMQNENHLKRQAVYFGKA